MTAFVPFLLLLTADVDKAALRKTVALPTVEVSVGMDTVYYGRVIARAKLRKLNAELLAKPDDADLLYEIGDACLEAAPTEANSFFEKALLGYAKIASPTPPQWRKVALCNLELGNTKQADAAASKLDEKSALVLQLKAEMALLRLFGQKQPGFAAALSQLQFFIRQPKEAILEAKTKLVEATVHARAAALAAPQSAETQSLLASCLVGEAFLDFALKTAAGESPSLPYAKEGAEAALKASNLEPTDLERAANCCAIQIMAEPFVAGKPTKGQMEALAIINKKAEAVFAGSGENREIAAEIRGVSAFFAGDNPTAIQWIQKARAIQPQDPRLADIEMNLNLSALQFQQAAEIGLKLMEAVKDPVLALKTAKCLEKTNQSADAETIIDKAFAAQPGSAYLILARVSYQLRDATGKGLSDARNQLDQLLAFSEPGWPGMDDLRFYRAVFYGLIGDSGEAKRIIEDLKKKKPEEEMYKKALQALG